MKTSLIVAGLLTANLASATPVEPKGAPMAAVKASKRVAPVEFRAVMRMLWEDHVMYTHAYVVSTLAGLDDATLLSQRLLKNQDDLGDAIKPFYGEDVGNKLTSLLRDHILIAADVVRTAKAGDAKGLAAAQAKWGTNADELATFLAGANPAWPEVAVSGMMHKHLELLTEAVSARLKKDWAGDIAAYDLGHQHMLMFADMLAAGVIKQHRKQFSK